MPHNTSQVYSGPYETNSGRRHNVYSGQSSPRNNHVLYGSHGNLNISQQSAKVYICFKHLICISNIYNQTS